MKRMTSMLLAMLMLFACVPAFAVEPTPTPEVHILTTSEETQKAVDRYQANVNYALETFGFDDSVAYPYLPTHIDPVCYRGYLSLVSGYKDGDCYAAYGGWSEEEVQDYLNFFTYLGYDCAERACDLPGVREWHCANPTPREDGKGLLENVKVFYAAEHEMLVIAYPYLDAFLYESWGEASMTYPYYKSRLTEHVPYTFEDVAGRDVTVERIIYTRDMSVVSREKPALRLHAEDPSDSHKMALELRDEPYHDTWIMLPSEDEEDLLLFILLIAFDEPVDKAYVDRLHFAAADTDPSSVHQAEFPMFYGWDDRCALYPWTEDTVADNLWVIFPYRICDIEEAKRVYLCVQEPGQQWMGDLRQWRQAEIYESHPGITMY